jgi:hypothetical protein
MCTVTDPEQTNSARIFNAMQMHQGNRFGGNYPKDFRGSMLSLLQGDYEFRWSKVRDGVEGQVLWKDRLRVDLSELAERDDGILLETTREVVARFLVPGQQPEPRASPR